MKRALVFGGSPMKKPFSNNKSVMTQFISHRLAGENLKGSAVTARARLMGANLTDAGAL